MVPFLRALKRTGEARTAAKDAGIDHTTAYARRRTHAEFAVAWKAALTAHEDAKARAEAEEIEGDCGAEEQALTRLACGESDLSRKR